MSTNKSSSGETYFGGKNGAGVWQTLINHVPPHDVLLVPFAGHCALSQHIAPCKMLVLCDLATEVKDWWNAGRLPDHAIFHQRDGLQLLELITAAIVAKTSVGVIHDMPRERIVIYCDPPYRLSTRTSKTRYQHDWTDAEHRRFLQAVSSLSAAGYPIMISHYRNPMYDVALSEWHRTDYTGVTRGGARTESLYCNFDVTELHDSRYFGGESSKQSSPRRQREVMKRREQSAIRKILAMSPMERQRFLRSLVAAFGDCAHLECATPKQATVDR